ncbi:MAG TPA: DUF2892 domain-containing protein [Fibrobacteria bacterium]|nr:DUF2892 domain-containing protein [Fibrobacteria bacterium]
MSRNMGTVDRILRLLVAATIGALYYMKIISGTVGIGLMVLAGIFVLTSLVRFCPLYLPFGIRTCRKES